MYKPKGYIISVITPFTRENRLDEAGFKEHLEKILDTDLHGVLIGGSNGEGNSLSSDELKMIFDLAVKVVGAKKQVICTPSRDSIGDTVALTQHCKDIRADAVMISPPYWIAGGDEGVLEYYKTISSSVDIPIVLYNQPTFFGGNLTPQFVSTLAKSVSQVVGIKEANPSVLQMEDQIMLNGEAISIMSGSGGNTLPALVIGAQGVMTTWPQFAPDLAMRLRKLVIDSRLDEARQLNARLLPLMRTVRNAPTLKIAFEMLGLPAGKVRPPLVALKPNEKEKIRGILHKLNLLH
jgi:4-hydroxy-tetrahydrodipicolinate synthase